MTLHLPPPQLLEIAGPDAAAFAHAQFSSDVQALQPRHWQWSAWLSAQGRVRAVFRLLRLADDRFWLHLSGGSAAALRSSLTPFVLRAKVAMQTIDLQAIGAFENAEATAVLGAAPVADALVEHGESIGFAIPGAAPRWCALGRFPAAATDSAALNRWRAADIADGLVELDDAQRERFLPDALGLSGLGAISVRKGCYPGQEIVARLHFKGGNKRWLHRLDYESAVPPAAGSPVSDPAGAVVGELLNSAETAPGRGIALAVLMETAAGTALSAGGPPGS